MKIEIKGARHNNLKNIDISIPHHQFIVVSGVSGSGKSSLVFDLIANEGKREFLESIPNFAKKFSGKLASPEVDSIQGLFPVISVEQSKSKGSSQSTLGTISDLYDQLRLLFSRFGQSENDFKLSRAHFSFNTNLGRCSNCLGIGQEEDIAIHLLIANENLSLREGALVPTLPNGYIMYSQVTVDVLDTVCKAHGFSVDIPWKELSLDQQNIILYGSDRIKVAFGKHSIESRLKWTGIKAKPREEGFYKGMLPIMRDILKRDRNKNILRFVESSTCSTCNGNRLNPSALSVKYAEQNISYYSSISLVQLLKELSTKINTGNPEQGLIQSIIGQIELMISLGLGHLSISTPSTHLSSGEIQRLKLVNQVGSGLSNILYVFDEPSIGLHPKFRNKLIQLLHGLVDHGNTVIVVEHDLEFIQQADYIIELGPKAGQDGGEILFNGTLNNFLRSDHSSPTKKALQLYQTPFPEERTNNIIGLIGLPDAGMKEFIEREYLTNKENTSFIHQAPIGQSPRSNPSTYIGLSDLIRDLFSKTPEAKKAGFKKSMFSFNVKGGRCETCEGAGKITLGMHYMGNVELNCSACNGSRFSSQTLSIPYQGKSIAEVYDLNFNQALRFFEMERKIVQKIQGIVELGLGYVKLGQSSNSLSGGEAQRIRLAKQLLNTGNQQKTFILEFPSVGLHYLDVIQLQNYLISLEKDGHRFILIDHHTYILQHVRTIYKIEKGEIASTSAYSTYKESEESYSFTGRKKSPLINFIELRGIQTNHLKNIDISIPKNKITCIIGISGSGKSSLGINTLYDQASNAFLSSFNTHTRSFIKAGKRANLLSHSGLTPAISVSRKNLPSSPRSTVGTLSGIDQKLRFLYSRNAQKTGKYKSASDYSFNEKNGACIKCSGLGYILQASTDLLIKDWEQSILGGGLTFNSAIKYFGNPDGQFVALLKEVAKHYEIKLDVPFLTYEEKELAILFHGTGDEIWNSEWIIPSKTETKTQDIKGTWKGFCGLIDEEYEKKKLNKNITSLEVLLDHITCPSCHGKRLNDIVLLDKIDGVNIADLSNLTISELKNWFKNDPNNPIKKFIFPFIKGNIQTMIDLGLGHLQNSRTSSSLSGGEGQRLQLAKHLHSSISGITYILDEPSAGLHNSDITNLIKVIRLLKEKGNTVVLMEHHSKVISTSDYLIELGPGAGMYGGEILYSGEFSNYPKKEEKKLNEKVSLQKSHDLLSFNQIKIHSLRKDQISFPKGTCTSITGISGSGKSTLLKDVILPSIRRKRAVNCQTITGIFSFYEVVHLDQNLFPKKKKETIGEYLSIQKEIISRFLKEDSTKALQFKKANFDLSHKLGKCPECNGYGETVIPMDFTDDVFEICSNCTGQRYHPETLKVKMDQRNIYQMASLSFQEINFDFPIKKKLIQLGLGHLNFLSFTSNLSIGEQQRLRLLKLFGELENKPSLLLLDEPSSGLHSHDIKLLLSILNELISNGHTIVFSEHNSEMIHWSDCEIKL